MTSLVFNCVYSTAKGGLEQMFINYTLALSKKYIVICIVPEDFKYFGELKSNKIRFETIKIRNYYDLIAAFKFIKLYKKHKPCFTLSHNGRFNSTIEISSFLSNFKKTIAICHGDTKRLSSFSKVLTVNSTLEKNLLLKKIKDVSTLPNYIEIHALKQKTTKSDKRVFTFGVISRLSPEKSVIHAIQAFNNLRKTNNIEFKLRVAGTGPDMEMLYKYVEKNNLQNIVSFSGWVYNKNEFYGSIDCFILTSLYEPFGLTILEAFSYSLPVISSRVDGPKEIIEDNINGFLYDSCNIEQLTALMLKVYKNPTQSAKVGAAGFCTLDKVYSKREFESNLFNLISQVK